MSISIDTVDKVSVLAKLHFEDSEKQAITDDLNKILVYIDKLNELDTEGIEPLIFLTEEFNTMAEDIQQPPLSKDEALHNAPQRDSDYFKVPKFLDRD